MFTEWPRKDRCVVVLISGALPFGRLWYAEPNAVSERNRTTQSFAADHIAL